MCSMPTADKSCTKFREKGHQRVKSGNSCVTKRICPPCRLLQIMQVSFSTFEADTTAKDFVAMRILCVTKVQQKPLLIFFS